MTARAIKLTFAGIMIAIACWLFLYTTMWNDTIHEYEQRFKPIDQIIPESSRQRVFLDNDPYYWLIYANEMVERKIWRIHFTMADNTPDGRDVHWSQSISWLMVIFGFVRKAITGQDWPGALEDASIWINPSIYILMALVCGWMLAKRTGLLPAISWLALFGTLGVVSWAFHPLRPDHQSLHVFFSALSALLLGLGGLGWIGGLEKQEKNEWQLWRQLQPPGKSTARCLMIASGVAGGLGLWTGASVQLLTLGATAATAIYLVMNMPLKTSENAYSPELWRVWAVSGSVTGLFFYLVEYAGIWPGLKLEINSPLHAISWLCVGELLVHLARRRMKGTAARSQMLYLLPLVIGSLLVPLAIMLGPEQWHAMRSLDMQRMHNFIQEFYTFTNYSKGAGINRIWISFGFLPLIMPISIWLSGARWSTTYEWGLLWLGFALSITMGILSWLQVRWLPFFAVSLLMLIPFTLSILDRLGRKRPFLAWTAPILFLSTLSLSAWQLSHQWEDVNGSTKNPNHVVEELTKAILTKNLALQMGYANTNSTFRFMCEPDLAGPLYYFGNIPSVSSFYWENMNGLRDSIMFFSGRHDSSAKIVTEKRGLSHVLLPNGTELADIFFYMREGHFDPAQSSETFIGQLLQGDVPFWLKLDQDLTRSGHTRYHFGPGIVNSTMTVLKIVPERLTPLYPREKRVLHH